jgi:arylformamidase
MLDGMIDVTRSLSNLTPVWPGDTPFTYEAAASIAAGDSVNVGRVRTTTHVGTHVDAPWHYDDGGLRLHEVPLETWVGPCLVVEAIGADRITPATLAGVNLAGVSKVLFKTGLPDEWPAFPTEWPVVDPSLPAFLAQHGIDLLGTDAPSADSLNSKDLPGHHALKRAGVCILESLALEKVSPGRYELVCLPLKLHGADGAPARVILR